MAKITDYAAIGATAPGDLLLIVDVSDTSMAATGTDKKIPLSQLPSAGGTLPGYLAPAVVPLTFGASIAVNAAAGNVFTVTLTSSAATIANPAGPADGQVIRFRVTQDGTGSRTLAYGTAYDFGAAGAPVLSTAAGKVDVLAFEYVAALAKWCCLGSGLGF